MMHRMGALCAVFLLNSLAVALPRQAPGTPPPAVATTPTPAAAATTPNPAGPAITPNVMPTAATIAPAPGAAMAPAPAPMPPVLVDMMSNDVGLTEELVLNCDQFKLDVLTKVSELMNISSNRLDMTLQVENSCAAPAPGPAPAAAGAPAAANGTNGTNGTANGTALVTRHLLRKVSLLVRQAPTAPAAAPAAPAAAAAAGGAVVGAPKVIMWQLSIKHAGMCSPEKNSSVVAKLLLLALASRDSPASRLLPATSARMPGTGWPMPQRTAVSIGTFPSGRKSSELGHFKRPVKDVVAEALMKARSTEQAVEDFGKAIKRAAEGHARAMNENAMTMPEVPVVMEGMEDSPITTSTFGGPPGTSPSEDGHVPNGDRHPLTNFALPE